jgi:uncharacterized membrane protein YcaP (DUF421 family)
MVGNNTSLSGGLVAATTLFVLNYILKLLTFRFPQLSDLVQGKSVMLIYNGQIDTENLRRAKISMEELNEALREHGVASARDADLAVLELDGNISVLSHDFTQKTTTLKHKGKRQNKNHQG